MLLQSRHGARYNLTMDQETQNKLLEMNAKIDEIYVSVEKTRKYLFWTMVVTIGVIVLPIIGLMFALPSFLSNYTEAMSTLGI